MIQNEQVNPNNGEIASYLKLFYKFSRKVENQLTPLTVLKMLRGGEAFLLGSKLDGVARAYAVLIPKGSELLIEQGYSESSRCTRTFFRYICKWAEREHFVRLLAYSDRVSPAWERLLGLKPISVKLVREL